MKQSWKSRLRCLGFNSFPAYFGTGARITYIADDWREVHVRLPLSLRTRNYVGTIFGGSLYGAVDPLYMVMLIKTLGSDYTVWDESAAIHFKKPGKTTLFAHIQLDQQELDTIRTTLETTRSIDRLYTVELKDARGVVYAIVEKTIYIRRNTPLAGNLAPAPAAIASRH